MKVFECDKCGKKVKEHDLYDYEDKPIEDLLNKKLESFEFKEGFYLCNKGDLCGHCIIDTLIDDLKQIKK